MQIATTNDFLGRNPGLKTEKWLVAVEESVRWHHRWSVEGTDGSTGLQLLSGL